MDMVDLMPASSSCFLSITTFWWPRFAFLYCNLISPFVCSLTFFVYGLRPSHTCTIFRNSLEIAKCSSIQTLGMGCLCLVFRILVSLISEFLDFGEKFLSLHLQFLSNIPRFHNLKFWVIFSNGYISIGQHNLRSLSNQPWCAGIYVIRYYFCFPLCRLCQSLQSALTYPTVAISCLYCCIFTIFTFALCLSIGFIFYSLSQITQTIFLKSDVMVFYGLSSHVFVFSHQWFNLLIYFHNIKFQVLPFRLV